MTLLPISRWRLIRFVRRLPVRQRQRLTFDQYQQLRCRIVGQLTLSRSCVCCQVLQPSTVISNQYRPGSLSVLRWCLLHPSVWCVIHHCDPVCFLTYTNMPLSFRGWRSRHSTPTIWTLIDQYRTLVLFRNLWKESLLADLSTSVRRLIPSTMTFCLKYYKIASWSMIFHFRGSTRT